MSYFDPRTQFQLNSKSNSNTIPSNSSSITINSNLIAGKIRNPLTGNYINPDGRLAKKLRQQGLLTPEVARLVDKSNPPKTHPAPKPTKPNVNLPTLRSHKTKFVVHKLSRAESFVIKDLNPEIRKIQTSHYQINFQKR